VRHITSTRAATLVLLCLLRAAGAEAQVLSLPNGSLYKAGPDYATDVLQDPWDFLNGQDVASDPDQVSGWSDPANNARLYGTGPAYVSGGWFRGVPLNDPNVMLLYRPDAHGINPGRSGARYPIDSSRYRKLALKMKVTNLPAPSQLVAYWFHAGIGDTNWQNRSGGAILGVTPSGTSEAVYVLDLASVASPLPGQGAAAALYDTPGEVVRGLRIDPVFASAGLVEIDWVRLTASNSGPEAALMPVTLSGCAAFQSLTITDAAAAPVTVSDSTGNDNTRTFNYGILPPGAYTIQAICGNGTTAPVGFTVNTPPTVTVIDPDETGNPATDYALLNRGGDRWDFEQVTDVPRTFNVSATGGACGTTGPCGIVPTEVPGATGNMLRASSIDTGPGTVGDPGLEMLNGALVPLNSRRHRLLTFSIRNRRPYLLNATVGPVLRVLWGSGASGDAFSMTVSQDVRVWPGLNTYTIDLGSLSTSNGGIETDCAPTCPTIPWTTRAIRFLRFDPHEYNDAATTFDVDDMTLAAPDEVNVGQQFTVRYAFSDPDAAGATFTARIYREDWTTRSGRTLVASLPSVAPGNLTFVLDPQARGVPPGRYAISIEVDEIRGGFTQTSRAYATGPLEVVNLAISAPTLSVDPPIVGGPIAPNLTSFTIQGCAYDAGATSGIGMDDIAATATALTGERAGRTIPLGFVGPPRGTLAFGPLGSAVVCPSIADPASPFRNAGFRFSNVGLENGQWILRVYARSSVSGQMVQFADIPLAVGTAPLTPVNFQASAAGNTVTVSFQAPAGGSPISGYVIEGATNANFSPPAFSVPVGAPGTYSGTLASGTYYLRAFSRDRSGNLSTPTAGVRVDVALPAPPGAPVLVAAQVASNPVTLTWSPGPGGAPTNYTVHAGTAPGASNLAAASLGGATGVSAVAPVGITIYVRVVAANAAGSAISNEIAFTLAPPPAPTLSNADVANGNVTLRWTSVPGASSYTLLARYPGSPSVIASLPVVGGTSVTVPAPSGTYVVTVVAINRLGTSAESNAITVVVP
jgi:hypothetical protein